MAHVGQKLTLGLTGAFGQLASLFSGAIGLFELSGASLNAIAQSENPEECDTGQRAGGKETVPQRTRSAKGRFFRI